MTPPARGQRPESSSAEPRILSLQSGGLREFFERIVTDTTRSRREQGLPPVAIALDVGESHRVAVDPVLLESLLRTAVLRAVEQSSLPSAGREVPHIAEVLVTSIDVGDAIEIEIADAGPGLHALHGSGADGLRQLADRAGAELTAIDCPVGGTAVTLRFPCRRARSLAA